MLPRPELSFDRGTLVLRGLAASSAALGLPGFLWDERSACFRAPALRYRDVVLEARATGIPILDGLAILLRRRTGPWTLPPLRDYQEDALRAFRAFSRRGIVALPTGSGKTRVALAALAALSAPALILCPTRALLQGWRRELARWYGGSIGVVGDGDSSVHDVTLMTFESGYRHLDRLGDRFATVVVDEVHHFGSGVRAEALEMCPAPFRLGLSATPPAPDTAAAQRLAELVGPVVCEVGMQELAGTHLATLETVRLAVRLDPEERAEYERNYRPFATLRAAFVRANHGSDWTTCLRAMAQTPEGRAAISGFHRAVALASYNAGKARLVTELLDRHASDRVLVFTARADDAYAVSEKNLVPAITAEIERKYGHALASFFPAVAATPGWSMEARVVLRGECVRLTLAAGDPIASGHALPRDADSTVERCFARDVRRLASAWTLERETAAVHAGGSMFFPDFTLRRGDDVVYVEIVGYYTPEYLRSKLEALRRAELTNLVVCVDDELACEDGEVHAAELVRYRRRVDASKVIEAAERVCDSAAWRSDRGILREEPARTDRDPTLRPTC